jgi:hypothetical protein
MAQFLKTSAPPEAVTFEIVDTVPKIGHFSSVLGTGLYTLHQPWADLDCVPRSVINNCIPDTEDKLYVTRMTHWRNQQSSADAL